MPSNQTMRQRADASYGEYLEVLLALITYFGLTGWRSRSPNGLARDLSLDEELVTATLKFFPGLFRRGSVQQTDAGPQHSYTLHARYALRRPRPEPTIGQQGFDGRQPSLSDPTSQQDGRGEELDPETLRALLDFVSGQARVERDSQHQQRSQRWVALGVVIAAAASVTAAIIQVVAQ